MKIYNGAITVQSKKAREVFDLTSQVKAAMEKSAFRDGIILVSALHANAAVVVNDTQPGLLGDLEASIGEVAPVREDFKHKGRFESNAAIHFQSLLLHHQVIVAFTEGRLDL